MKHSNWILGIGVIVAIILIAGSVYFGFKSMDSADIPTVDASSAISTKTVTNYIFITLKDASQQLITIIE